MERRERYDPEDIEQLLGERSFNELLEEERAYVLRHLSGAEEYELMRALLLRMRTEETGTAPIEADPGVRERVLATFRSGQRPAWRIWLNSVGTLLQPRETSGYWRPALALAGLALLIVAGIAVVRTLQPSERSSSLAEQRQVPVKTPSASDDAKEPMTATDTALPVVSAPTLPNHANEDAFDRSRPSSGSSFEEKDEAVPVAGSAGDLDLAKADNLDVAESDRTKEAEMVSEDVRMVERGTVVESTAFKNLAAAEAGNDQQLQREVVAVRSTKRERSKSDNQRDQEMVSASRSLAQDHAVLGLVNQGW